MPHPPAMLPRVQRSRPAAHTAAAPAAPLPAALPSALQVQAAKSKKKQVWVSMRQVLESFVVDSRTDCACALCHRPFESAEQLGEWRRPARACRCVACRQLPLLSVPRSPACACRGHGSLACMPTRHTTHARQQYSITPSGSRMSMHAAAACHAFLFSVLLFLANCRGRAGGHDGRGGGAARPHSAAGI